MSIEKAAQSQISHLTVETTITIKVLWLSVDRESEYYFDFIYIKCFEAKFIWKFDIYTNKISKLVSLSPSLCLSGMQWWNTKPVMELLITWWGNLGEKESGDRPRASL